MRRTALHRTFLVPVLLALGLIATPALARKPAKVQVVNFPNPQTVAGAVSVSNLPVDQNGQVMVSFPATQNVGGTISVSNLPLDVSGRLRVTGDARGSRFRYVGLTSVAFNGAGGWSAMSRACASEHPGSRIAFYDEYRTTVDPPDVTGTSWIAFRPILVSPYGGHYGGSTLVDASGATFPGSAPGYGYDCESWSTALVYQGQPGGAVVTPTGSLDLANCDNNFPVACAAPE